MIDEKLLAVIACPETGQDLVLAEPEMIEKLNHMIEDGLLMNRTGQKVTQKLEAGLVRKEDRKYLYPVRDDIPVLLIDESILLENDPNL